MLPSRPFYIPNVNAADRGQTEGTLQRLRDSNSMYGPFHDRRICEITFRSDSQTIRASVGEICTGGSEVVLAILQRAVGGYVIVTDLHDRNSGGPIVITETEVQTVREFAPPNYD